MTSFYLGSILSILLTIAGLVEGPTLIGGPEVLYIPPLLLIPIFWFIGSANFVNEWERRPVMRLGQYRETIGPGFCTINPAIDWCLSDVPVNDQVTLLKIDGVQTKDNVPVGFVFVLTTRVLKDKVRDFVVNVADGYQAVASRSTAAANEIVRTFTLDEILSDGDRFKRQILTALELKLQNWGVEAEALEIREFAIQDKAIQEAIAMKARAKKEAEGELMRAEMQKQIAVQLDEAAAALDEKGWRLKSMEVLLELCRSANNNTILIPSDLTSLAKVFVSKELGG